MKGAEPAPLVHPPQPMKSTGRITIVAALWVAAFVLALACDRPVAEWVQRQGWDVHRALTPTHHAVNFVLKIPGEYLFTLAVAVALALAHPGRWRAGVFVAVAGAVSGLNGVVKWVVGRYRPVREEGIHPFDFHPFAGGLHGLFAAKNLCFPSGHACLAFATAAAVGIVMPRWKYWLFVPAVIVGVERVLENAHYVSDVVGAAALGILAAHLTWHILRRLTRTTDAADTAGPGPATTPAVPVTSEN
jgi:membrane-associated phospholipid phosphatase